MTITHHPDISNLMCCAAGSQPEAFAAVIAGHLSLCPACRAEVRRMQDIGVALFDTLEPAELSAVAPVVAMRACEAEAQASPPGPCAAHTGDVPQPLVACLGARLDDVRWRWTAPGVWTFAIPCSEGCCGRLRLMKVAPGMALPEHGHTGQEMTLVLRGSFTDALGTYRTGDVADIDESVEHSPVACPKAGCICLVATDGKLRFKSVFGRLLRPLFGL